MALLRNEGQRWRDLEGGEATHLTRCGLDVVAVPLQDVLCVLELVEDRTSVDVADRVQPELKGRYDPEVTATAADRPEEVLVLLLAREQELSVRRDNVGRDQVVARKPVVAGEIANPSAQGEAADARGGDDASRARQAERVGRGVVVAPCGPTLGARGPPFRIDAHATHP